MLLWGMAKTGHQHELLLSTRHPSIDRWMSDGLRMYDLIMNVTQSDHNVCVCDGSVIDRSISIRVAALVAWCHRMIGGSDGRVMDRIREDVLPFPVCECAHGTTTK